MMTFKSPEESKLCRSSLQKMNENSNCILPHVITILLYQTCMEKPLSVVKIKKDRSLTALSFENVKIRLQVCTLYAWCYSLYFPRLFADDSLQFQVCFPKK